MPENPDHLNARARTASKVKRIADRIKSGRVPALEVRTGENTSITVEEILTLCDANPTHPHADIFRRAVEGMPDDKKVAVDKVDILALAENFEADLHVDQVGVFDFQSKVKGRSLDPIQMSTGAIKNYEPDSLADNAPVPEDTNHRLEEVIPEDTDAPHDPEDSGDDEKDHYHGDLTEDPDD